MATSHVGGWIRLRVRVSVEGEALEEVRRAQRAVTAARVELRSAVDRAHADGASWAAIGAVLGISRQAAFKRFGRPRDPRTGDEMNPTDLTPLFALTERVFTLVDAGDYVTLRELMGEEAARDLTRGLVLDTWAGVVSESGNLTGCCDTRLESLDGTVLAPSESTLGPVVAQTTIVCAAGEWWGRVAFDPDQRVIGLLVVPVGATNLAF